MKEYFIVFGRLPKRSAMTVLPLCILIFMTILISVSGGDPGGREAFRKGRAALEAGRYQEAVSEFLIAQREFPILEDYALLYLADAYHNLGDHPKSEETLGLLIGKYPSSLLRKKAGMAEIREASETGSRDRTALFEAYTKDFPEDDEAAFTYANLLEKNGSKDKAKAVFRRLYIRTGPFSTASREQLSDSDISTSDLIERASSLAKQYDFDDAEQLLRKALASCSGKNRQEVRKNLAYALFKQKKYREAAELYGEVNDLFYKARSLYRAGDKKGFEKTLEDLTGQGNKKAGYLLLTVAADRRRAKDFEGALKIYREILKNYPADEEEALWGLGWTEYLSGDYRKAEETFSKLHAKYDEPRYLYWQARSIESQDRDASGIYGRIAADNNNYYAALSYARGRKIVPKLSSLSVNGDSAPEKVRKNPRVEALISLDMKAEAIAELAALYRNSSSAEDLLYSAARFQELGEFKRSVSLSTKIPYSEKMHRFWYPLAFWDNVQQAAGRNNLDPLIILSVMREESRFDQAIKSPAGAYGLMQLMPQTAYRLDKSLKLGIHRPSQLTDPRNNIQLGSFYLKALLDEFRSLPHMLAAYNAGELAVRSWQQRFEYRETDEFIEDIPYNETRNYVKKVLTSYFQYSRSEKSAAAKSAGIGIILGKAL